MTESSGSVLVVDDNPTNLNLLIDYLTAANFEVFAAEEGQSALDLLAYIEPDIILLDVMMPEMNGFETCRRLKAQPATREIPVIFMTALTDTADKVQGFEAGGVDYITKPVHHAEVLARIKTHLELSRLQKRLQEQNIQLRHEVAERKRTEAALRESQAYLAAIFNAVHAGILLIDAQTRTIADANPATLQMLGVTQKDAVVGQICHRFICPATQGKCPVLDLDVSTDNAEHVLVTAQGTPIPIIKSAAPITLGDRRYLLESFVSIAERKRAEEALQQYARDLEISNAELDAFAHTVAHDLKNPLTAMIGLSGMLQNHYAHLSADDVEKRLSVITRAGHRMTSIINELLLLSSVRKMEEVEAGPLDMRTIIADAQERLGHLIEKAQAEIIVPRQWPVALGYAPWIEEVWTNYISNALKYGGQPQKGIPVRIILGATEEIARGTVRFWVRDNGEGLSPEQQARLFAPFERLGQAHAEGHGLGLSIARRIVEKLGGEVGIESEVGAGSTFYFTLPAVKPA